MMTKQALLENVLDMFLTKRQMDAIEKDWKVFYTDPLKYKDSVVVDLVKEYVGIERYTDEQLEKILTEFCSKYEDCNNCPRKKECDEYYTTLDKYFI